MSRLTRKIRYGFWALNGFTGKQQALNVTQHVTVLITYFNPLRMKHLNHQVRNVLKCNFVDSLIISNHNPDIHIEDLLQIHDSRLKIINQDSKRGCGYRWEIAHSLSPEYLIVIDDDILLYPSQIAALFVRLLKEPEIPHGFTGMQHQVDDSFIYHERQEINVDYLCEVYAVTKKHLQRYAELKEQIARDDALAKSIESATDFMLISQSGAHQPQIHRTNRLLRCETFKEASVAVHQKDDFRKNMLKVYRALNNIRR